MVGIVSCLGWWQEIGVGKASGAQTHRALNLASSWQSFTDESGETFG